MRDEVTRGAGNMRRRKGTRFLAMLLAVTVCVTSFSQSAWAAFDSTAQEADARDVLQKLESGKEIDAQDAKFILEKLGLFNEDGTPVTSKIIMDQKEYTLDEIKALLEGGTADLTKKVTVDGTELTLGNIQTMLQIEEELTAYQETYFPEHTGEYTPEMEATISSLLMQLNNGELSVKFKNELQVINRDMKLTVDTDVSVNPGETAVFKVSISAPVTHTIFVNYRTMDGLAKEGKDYEGKKGILRIPAGETSASLEINTINSISDTDESTWWNGDKLFYVEFTNVIGAVFESGTDFQYGRVGLKGNLAKLDKAPWETTTYRPEGAAVSLYGFYVPQQYATIIEFLDGKLDGDNNSGRISVSLGTFNEDKTAIAERWGDLEGVYDSSENDDPYMVDLKGSGLPEFLKKEGYQKEVAAERTYSGVTLRSITPRCKPVTGTKATLRPAEQDETYYVGSMIPCVLETEGNVPLGGPVSVLPESHISTDDGKRFGDTFSCLLTKEQYEQATAMCKAGQTSQPQFDRADYSWSFENLSATEIGKGTVSFVGFDTANNTIGAEAPKYVQDYITGIKVDKSTYDPGVKGEQTVNVTVTYDNTEPNDAWLWTDYANDYNKEGKESIDRLKVSLDGGATLHQLSPPLDEKNDPMKNGTLTAQIPLPYNTSGEERTYRAELFLMPGATETTVPAITGVKSDYSCLMGANQIAEFKVKPVNLIKAEDLSLEGLPEGNILYTVQEEATQLTCNVATENPTFPGIEWTSSDENVALIDRVTGAVIPKAEGTVKFTATAYNRKAGQPASVETPEMTVVNGGPPAIAVPKGMNIVHTKKNNKVSIYWMSNLNGKGNDQVYTVDLYEGDYTDKEAELPDKIVKTYTFTETVTGEIEENILSKVSKDGVPSYTFVIHTPSPENPEKILTGRGGIIVAPIPASVRLTAPEKLYVVDKETESLPVSWNLFDTEEGYEFQLSVKKNGEEIHTVTSGTSTSFPVDAVEGDTLKDVYTVTAKVRNNSTEDELWSTDSYLVQVYRDGAFAFDVEGERVEDGETVTIDNEERIDVLKNYDGNWTDADSDAIVALNREITLDKDIKLWDGTIWNMAADRFAWSSGDSSIMPLYRKESSGYTNVEKLASSYQAPDREFMMSGKQDGETTVKAVHSRTNKEIELTAQLSSLKDKLYLFQFTPMQETTLTYERKDGKTVTIHTNEKGQAAVYDPDGIQNPVEARSGSEKTTLYLGTTQADVLVSSEKDKGRNELYPVNYITLDEAAHVEVYLKDENGDPYTGKISYTGGLYKNGKYCPLVQDGSSDNRLEATLGQDGKWEQYYDVSKFYSEDEDSHTQLKAGDYLEFVYDIRTEGDAYYPHLLNVDSFSKVRGADFGDSIVNLRKNTDTSQKAYISDQRVKYPSAGGTFSVLDRKDSIGCSSQYPSIDLETDILCWGLDTEEEFQCSLIDEDQKKLGRQEYKLKRYPFTDIAVASNTTPIDENTGIAKGASERFTAQLYQGDKMVRSIPIPFTVSNMIGIDVSQEKQFKPFTVDVNLKQKTAGEAASAGGEVANKGLSKFNTGIDTPFFRLTVTPTVDPFVFRAFAGYDIDLLGMDTDIVMNPVDGNDAGANASAFVAAIMGEGKNLNQRFQNKMNTTMSKPGDTDFGGRAAGYMAGDIVYNTETQAFEFIITDSGFTLGAKMGYHWTFNSAVGFVPITAEFALGAAVELDYKAMAAYSSETDKFGSDILTTLRVNAYLRAFAGFGFDVAILALKIGLFGQINMEHYSQFLSRTYRKTDQQIQGHRTELTGIIGIEFVLKVFFIRYRKTLASAKLPTVTFKNGRWDDIQNWIAQSGLPDWGGNVTPKIMAMSGDELTEVASTVTMEDRSYLKRAATFSLADTNSTANVIQSSAYPYAYPQVTADGALTVALSDQGSTDINDTRVYWAAGAEAPKEAIPLEWTAEEETDTEALKILMPDYAGGTEAEDGEKTNVATPDSNVSLAGTGGFAVAAWEKLRGPVTMDQEAQLTDDQASLASSQMMNDTEIVASVYNGSEWVSTRLTDNKNADMAPQAAVSGNNAVVIYRSMASSNLDNPLSNDVKDELWYSRYSNEGWSDPAPLYRETNGTINALEAVMDKDGNTGITFTVEREDASSEEQVSDTFFMALKADNGITEPVRLTLGEGTNENAKITTADVEGESRFLTAWYQNRYDAELDSTIGDICFKVLDSDGVITADFPDSLSEMNTNGNMAIGSKFEFVKKTGNALESTGIAWAASDITPSDESSEDAEKDLLYVSMFKETENDIVMTPGIVAADPGNYTTVDSFVVWTADGKTMESMLLGTYYNADNASLDTIYEGVPVNTPEDTSLLMKDSVTLKNSISVDHVSFENEALQKGALLPLTFYVVNNGYETVNKIKITAGNTVLADETVSLLPGKDMMISASYPVPMEEGKNLANLSYKLTARYENSDVSTTDGTVVLNTPDVGFTVNDVNILKEAGGQREFQLQFYNDSANEIAKTGNIVKLGFYKSSGDNVPADVKILSQTEETQEPIGTGVYQLTQEQMELLDKDGLSLNFSYQLTEADTLPMNLYAKMWVEDKDGNQIMDKNVLNDDKIIKFQNLKAKNNGNQFETENDVFAEDGVTKVNVTVKNLERTRAEDLNVIVVLYDEADKPIETKYLAVTQDELLNLEGEGTDTRMLAFSQQGAYVRSAVVQQNFDEADASLQSLAAGEVSIEPAFDPAVQSYTGTAENLVSTTVTAIGGHPGAAITINGQPTLNGVLQVPLGFGENVITVEVTPVAEGIAPMTYELVINNKEVKRTGNLILQQADGDPNAQWSQKPVSYRIVLPEGTEDEGFTSYRFTTDNGTSWSEDISWKKGEENVIKVTAEGIYDNQIFVRLYREDGSYMESTKISAKLDLTPPVITDVTYEKLDADGNVLPEGTQNANWNGDLRILVHTSDALTGIKAVSGTMEAEPGTVYTAQMQEEGIYSFVVSPSYRGNILLVSEDGAGNTVKNSIRVNVDNKVPAGMLFECKVSETEPTAEPVTVELKTVHPDMVSDSIEYSIGDTKQWKSYKEPLVIEENTVIYYRAKDTSGNKTEVQTLTISNIDKNKPILKLTVNPEGWSAKDVSVTVTNEGRILGQAAFYYRAKGDDKWEEIKADESGVYKVTFTEEGEKTWQFKAVSPAGMESEIEEADIRIDREAPEGVLKIGFDKWDKLQPKSSKTIERGSDPTIKITAKDKGSGIRSVEYAVSDQRITDASEMGKAEGFVWKAYQSPVKVQLNKDKVTIVYARITDKAGNTIYLSSDDYKYAESKDVISKIENVLTGDTTPIVLYAVLMMAAVVVIAMVIRRRTGHR